MTGLFWASHFKEGSEKLTLVAKKGSENGQREGTEQESLKDLGKFSLVKKLIAEGSRKESAGQRMMDLRQGKNIPIPLV